MSNRSIDIIGFSLTSVSGFVTEDEMEDYVDIAISSISGTTLSGVGGVLTSLSGSTWMVDGTPLIAEDGDIVDGGTLS